MNALLKNYVSVVKNCLNFSGRASRSEFWWFAAVNFAAAVALQFVDAAFGAAVISTLFAVAMLPLGLAVTIRRIHDSDRSGWWLLVGLVPVLGGLCRTRIDRHARQ